MSKTEKDDVFLIAGYGATTFRVAGKVQEGAVLISANYAEPAPVAALGDLAPAHAAPIKQALGDLDVLLIGTGKSMAMIPAALRQAFDAEGIPVDPMDTGAAARTYNVLVTEGRRVACLLFPLGD